LKESEFVLLGWKNLAEKIARIFYFGGKVLRECFGGNILAETFWREYFGGNVLLKVIST
jgi:hypothetical protein